MMQNPQVSPLGQVNSMGLSSLSLSLINKGFPFPLLVRGEFVWSVEENSIYEPNPSGRWIVLYL